MLEYRRYLRRILKDTEFSYVYPLFASIYEIPSRHCLFTTWSRCIHAHMETYFLLPWTSVNPSISHFTPFTWLAWSLRSALTCFYSHKAGLCISPASFLFSFGQERKTICDPLDLSMRGCRRWDSIWIDTPFSPSKTTDKCLRRTLLSRCVMLSYTMHRAATPHASFFSLLYFILNFHYHTLQVNPSNQ